MKVNVFEDNIDDLIRVYGSLLRRTDTETYVNFVLSKSLLDQSPGARRIFTREIPQRLSASGFDLNKLMIHGFSDDAQTLVATGQLPYNFGNVNPSDLYFFDGLEKQCLEIANALHVPKGSLFIVTDNRFLARECKSKSYAVIEKSASSINDAIAQYSV